MADSSGSSKTFKLVMFGATGPTGILAVKRALELGHHVTAIVRSPEKLNNIKNENLEVIEGNIFEPESLVAYLKDKDAVMSYLGTHGASIFNPTTLYTESMKAITTAMERSSVNRIVIVTSWCTEKQPGNPKIYEWILKPLFLNAYLPDMREMEKMLEQSAFNYTFIRPPELTNDEPKKNYKLAEGQYMDGVLMKTPRADVADASLQVLQTQEWDRKGAAIGCN